MAEFRTRACFYAEVLVRLFANLKIMPNPIVVTATPRPLKIGCNQPRESRQYPSEVLHKSGTPERTVKTNPPMTSIAPTTNRAALPIKASYLLTHSSFPVVSGKPLQA